jgi:ABC-2 type transport system permease protein
MIGLVQNELIKIFEKKMSWIFAIILIIGLIGAAVLEMKLSPQQTEDNWKVQVQSEIDKLEKKMEKAPSYEDFGEDEYPTEETKEDIQVQIDNFNGNLNDNVNPYTTSWSYLGDYGIVLKSLITLFVVIVCAGNISSEFSDGTIKQLLIRPHRRWAILLSKYIALLIYSAFLIAVLVGIGYLVSIAFFGVGDFSGKLYMQNPITFDMEVTAGGAYFFKCLLYYLPGLIMVLTLAFMLSTLFKNQAIAVGIGVFVLFFSSTAGAIIVSLAEKYAWTKVLIFPHLDQTVFVLQDKILENITMPMSLGILGVYYLIFMFITFFFFQKRDISI